MASYQSGPGIGTVVGPDANQAGGSVRDVLSPSTPGGQALLVALGAFVLLLFTVAREGRITARILNAVGFVVVVLAASVVGQWAARQYVTMHPDGPLADGIRFDI